LVMISRMVRGDHYLSDVVFGGMISMTIFTLLKNDQKKRDR